MGGAGSGHTFWRGTLSFSGDNMARISLVATGAEPGSGPGAEPNSSLQRERERVQLWITEMHHTNVFICTPQVQCQDMCIN